MDFGNALSFILYERQWRCEIWEGSQGDWDMVRKVKRNFHEISQYIGFTWKYGVCRGIDAKDRWKLCDRCFGGKSSCRQRYFTGKFRVFSGVNK